MRPYDLGGLCRYRAAFLSGFTAEKAGVDVQQGWKRAQAPIENEMRNLARMDILRRADEAQVSGLFTDHSNVRYKLTLLPMYISSFTYKQKHYHVLVNGQSGKVGGQSPVSALRVALVVLSAIGLALLFYWLFMNGGQQDTTFIVSSYP